MTRPSGVFKEPAIFVPPEYYREVFKLSKAALADVAWNLAAGATESAEDLPRVMETLREEIKVTLTYRKKARAGAGRQIRHGILIKDAS